MEWGCGSWNEGVAHNAVIGSGDLLQLPLCKVDGLEKVPQALVASQVQLSRVHLSHIHMYTKEQ